jgi:Bacterial Ig domain
MFSLGDVEGERMRKRRAIALLLVLLLSMSLLISFSQSPSRLPSIEPNVPVNSLSGPNPNRSTEFHLHWDGIYPTGNSDVMNTSGPYSPSRISYEVGAAIGITIEWKNKKDNHYFVISPCVNAPVTITGNAILDYWGMASLNNTQMDLTMRLFDSTDQVLNVPGDALIGATSILNEVFLSPTVTLHSISIPSLNYTIPANHYLILQVQRDDNVHENLYIGFDQTFYDSTLDMILVSNLNLNDSWLEGVDGNNRTEFGNQELINIFANASDSLGAYDIHNVTVIVRNQSSGTIVASILMTIDSTGPAALPAWELMGGSLNPLPIGNYSVNVTVLDNSLNCVWSNMTIKIIRVDHFIVALSKSSIVAGNDFNVTIEAVDQSGIRLENWSGMILIVALDNSTSLPILGLSNSSIFMSSLDKGIITLVENFTKAPETIRIQTTNETSIGLSSALSVMPDQVALLTITPNSVSMPAGTIRLLIVDGKDRFGNPNTTWQPYWSFSPPENGTLTPVGYSVQLLGVRVGDAVLNCRDNFTSLESSINVTVTSAPLSRIEVTPSNSTIWEGRSTAIAAVGYDAFDNVVGIPTATWSSEGFAMSFLTGSGQSGTMLGGMVPESGIIRVTVGSIVGTAAISIITPPFGPSLGLLGNQVLLEDQQKVITLNWQDVNGTTGLSWFVTGVNESLLIIGHNASSPNTVNVIPEPNANGINIVTFWVRDPTGYTNNRQISITVLPVNDPPVWINDPPIVIYVKFGLAYTFDYAYYVMDIDNNASQLILTPDPNTYIVSSGLNLTYTFPDLYSGQPYYRIVKLVISDGLASDELTITVWATSDTPPSLVKPLPDITIDEGQINYLAFDLDDYFSDPDGDILYYSQGFENVEVTIDTTTHIVYVSSPSEWSGQTTAVFIAKDPTGALRTETVIITVRPVNDPPKISEINPVFVHYGIEYSLDLRLYVTDPDNGFEELTITTSDPVNVTYSSIPYPHLAILYPANLSGGIYTGPYTVSLSLHVSDIGGLSDQRTFYVIVSDNNPPTVVIDPPEFISFMEDTELVKPYSLDLGAIFSDADSDKLTFTFYGNQNISITLSPDGWVNFSAAKDWNGDEDVIFEATDPKGAWASFSITVVVIPVNDPPILDAIADIDHYGGRQWSIDIKSYIHDVDDPYLSHIEVLVVSPSFVRAVGTVLYFEFPDGTDSTQVTIYVTDGIDNSNYVTFKVEIKQTIAEMIGYPWSLIIVILIAGIVGYFLAFRVFPHKIEQLFLIHNDGRLIHHEGKESGNGMDQDVVSAMFTAVQEFIQDSFKEESGGLKQLEFGDKKILIEKGKWIYAAMIYSGLPPKSVFKNLAHFVQDIEEGYGESIEHWDGTLKSLPGVQEMSRKMILKKYHASENHGDFQTRLEDMKAEKPSEPDEKT